MATRAVITGYGGPAVPADTLQLLGHDFGRVSSAALIDLESGHEHQCDFIVDSGSSVTITVPQLTPYGTYLPVLGTLDQRDSLNIAGPLVVAATPVISVTPEGWVPPTPRDPTVRQGAYPLPEEPPPPVDPRPPLIYRADPVTPTPAPSAARESIRSRLRMELGDYEQSFQATSQGDGMSRRFDLPVEVINGGSITVVTSVELGEDEYGEPLLHEDYELDARDGVLVLPEPPANDELVTVTGTHWQFFTDAELDAFIDSAAAKHTHTAETLEVFRDTRGFKRFVYEQQTVDTIPPVEWHPVALLAATEALEVLRTDAAYDIDVVTADGTSLPRTQRFANIGELIAEKRTIYDDLCRQLGVGLNRIEVFTQRRVSLTTGRLVPVYVPREFDDRRPIAPLRLFAPRNRGITGSGFVRHDGRGNYQENP